MKRIPAGLRVVACLASLMLMALAWCAGAESRVAPEAAAGTCEASSDGASIGAGDLLPVAALGTDDGAADAGERIARCRPQRAGAACAAAWTPDAVALVPHRPAARETLEVARASEEARPRVRRQAADPPCASI